MGDNREEKIWSGEEGDKGDRKRTAAVRGGEGDRKRMENNSVWTEADLSWLDIRRTSGP